VLQDFNKRNWDDESVNTKRPCRDITHSRGSATVDDASQCGNWKFDLSARSNPLTDRHQTLHT